MATTNAARSATSVFQVGENVLDRAVLVVRFLVGEAVDELRERTVRLGDRARPCRTDRGRPDELARDLPDPLLHARLATLPCFAAEAVERDAFVLAAVPGQELDVLNGNVELVAARILQRHAVVGRLRDGD